MVCKVCGDYGHSKASCHYTKAKDLANMSHEDVVFWRYVHPLDRPDSLRQDDSLGEEDSEEAYNEESEGVAGLESEESSDQESDEASDQESEEASDQESEEISDQESEESPTEDNFEKID